MSHPLQFLPFSSNIDVSFWRKLSFLKLNKYKLADTPLVVSARYAASNVSKDRAHLNFSEQSFGSELDSEIVDDNLERRRTECIVSVKLINFNTAEEFKQVDKNDLLNEAAVDIWKDIVNGKVLEESSLLLRALLISYADIKKNKYMYWLAVPSFSLSKQIDVEENPEPVHTFFNDYDYALYLQKVKNLWTENKQMEPFFCVSYVKSANEKLIQSVESLSDFLRRKKNKSDIDSNEVLFAFIDPCPLDKYPGWPLRNFLVLIGMQWINAKVDVLCFRKKVIYADGTYTFDNSQDRSIVLRLNLANSSIKELCDDTSNSPAATGWEFNARGKLGPRMIDLSHQIDPVKLAEQSVHLNVRLMRWRVLPNLNVDLLNRVKCILFGAGPLGCDVGRCLLGWGVKHITFVDDRSVEPGASLTHSLLDVSAHGKYKAVAAADSMAHIYPRVISTGHIRSYPSLNELYNDKSTSSNDTYSCSESGQRKNAEFKNECPSVRIVQDLKKLIESHDAIFILDEERKRCLLPIVVSSAENKLTIYADSFRIVRHGSRPSVTADGKMANRLACGLCYSNANDDCTNYSVHRTIISYSASAFAVELFIGVLHHHLGHKAPSIEAADAENSQSVSELGLLPHTLIIEDDTLSIKQIIGRGFGGCEVSTGSEWADSNCDGCSANAVQRWENYYTHFVEPFSVP